MELAPLVLFLNYHRFIQVIVLKNGSVIHQGTPSDIQQDNPELYDTWVTAGAAAMALDATSASEGGAGDRHGHPALRQQIAEREKEMRFRQASRLSRASSILEDDETLDEYGSEPWFYFLTMRGKHRWL